MSTTTASLARASWPQRAACRNANPELFAPRSVTGRPGEFTRALAIATRYCASCPVRTDCQTWADDTKAEGIWGGINRIREHTGRGQLVHTPLLPTPTTETTPMKYSTLPADGVAMTLDDLQTFVTEMRELRELPGHTVVRAMGLIEIDLANGPRIARLTADTDTPRPSRAQRRAAGQRGPRGGTR